MARERYLVGVSKEELEYTPPPPPPQTPKGKLENFWYHYKWVTLGVLFLVVLGAVLFGQLFTRTKPDYILCVVVQQELSRNTVERLQQEFAAVGTDQNGDGEVIVTVQSLNIADSGNMNGMNTGHQTMMGHLVARDVIFFALDPTYYTQTVAPALKGDATFFAPLTVTGNGVGEDGTYWNWNGIELLKESDFQTYATGLAAPENLYFGVRSLPENASEAQTQEYLAYMALLEAFITAQS